MAPPSSAFALMGEAALGLAAKDPFFATLINEPGALMPALQAIHATSRGSVGVQIKAWSPEIIAALQKNWHEVFAEESAANPQFKKVWESYSKFRADYAIWRDHGYLK
jgi:hypothetical protein